MKEKCAGRDVLELEVLLLEVEFHVKLEDWGQAIVLVCQLFAKLEGKPWTHLQLQAQLLKCEIYLHLDGYLLDALQTLQMISPQIHGSKSKSQL